MLHSPTSTIFKYACRAAVYLVLEDILNPILKDRHYFYYVKKYLFSVFWFLIEVQLLLLSSLTTLCPVLAAKKLL
jgi:hypothetical protein